MKDWIRNLLTDEEKLKYVKFGIIPLVAVILIIVIVIVDKPVENAPMTNAETVAETEPAPAVLLDETLIAKAAEPLKENAVPEIQTLMENYFQARLTADPELLGQVFDSASMAEDNELVDRMSQQTEHIETYQNVVCYTKDGPDADSYVVFVSFDIKFLQIDTLAPSLLWCYVEKKEDGSYRIVEVPDEETSQYIVKVEQSEDVKQLAEDVNAKLAEAVAADGKLASVYNILRTGLTDSSEGESTGDTQAADASTEAMQEESDTAGQETAGAQANATAASETTPETAPETGSQAPSETTTGAVTPETMQTTAAS